MQGDSNVPLTACHLGDRRLHLPSRYRRAWVNQPCSKRHSRLSILEVTRPRRDRHEAFRNRWKPFVFFATLNLAVRNLLLHKLRSVLTLLGTILGVASVIAMLSIGEGSKREALEQIRRLGAANVIIRSVKPQPSNNTSGAGSSSSSSSSSVLSYGLTYADLRLLQDVKLGGCTIVPSVMHKKNLQHASAMLWSADDGTTADLPKVKDLHIKGRFFSQQDVEASSNVIVIGQRIATEIFGFEDPIGQTLLVGDDAYRVIGVVGYRDSGSAKTHSKDTSDQNDDLYIPITSAQNRMGIVQRLVETGSRQYVRIELSEITIELGEQSAVRPFASVVRTMLAQSHAGKKDYEVQVPLELLNQAEREKRLWNLVLGFDRWHLFVGGRNWHHEHHVGHSHGADS